jgi:hypothetical protein
MTRNRSGSGHLVSRVLVASLVASSACVSHPPYQHPDLRTDSHGDVVNQRRDDAARHAPGAPSPGRPETPPAQPGPEYSWGSGQHSWDGNDFQWRGGEWAVPPTGYYAWTAASWQKSGTDNWVYVEGHWQ